MISKEAFQEALTLNVRKETSSVPELWTPKNPLFGHCVVAALVAQDYFGGRILRASLQGTAFENLKSHYWNGLEDGEVDFTSDQFQGNKPALVGVERDRAVILTSEWTRGRYDILSEAISTSLNRG